jgi:predicted O-methyltransferase YrrM
MASTPGTTAVVQAIDVLSFLLQTSEKYDLAWVDDDHTKPHVTRELMALIPKMNPGGLILLHDVFGSTDLQEVVRHFGGYSIKLPRLGPAGGLGVIQVQ